MTNENRNVSDPLGSLSDIDSSGGDEIQESGMQIQAKNSDSVARLISVNTFGQMASYVAVILAVELALIYTLPSDILTNHPWLNWLVDAFARIAGSMGMTEKYIPNREAVRVYMAISLLLMIPKSYIIFVWLNGDRQTYYRTLVISPLTTNPLSVGDYVLEPGNQSKKSMFPMKARSMRTRVIMSLFFIALTLMMISVLFYFQHPPIESPKEIHGIQKLNAALFKGGIDLWFEWSALVLTLVTFHVAVCLCIIRDYWTYFQMKIAGKTPANID